MRNSLNCLHLLLSWESEVQNVRRGIHVKHAQGCDHEGIGAMMCEVRLRPLPRFGKQGVALTCLLCQLLGTEPFAICYRDNVLGSHGNLDKSVPDISQHATIPGFGCCRQSFPHVRAKTACAGGAAAKKHLALCQHWCGGASAKLQSKLV